MSHRWRIVAMKYLKVGHSKLKPIKFGLTGDWSGRRRRLRRNYGGPSWGCKCCIQGSGGHAEARSFDSDGRTCTFIRMIYYQFQNWLESRSDNIGQHCAPAIRTIVHHECPIAVHVEDEERVRHTTNHPGWTRWIRVNVNVQIRDTFSECRIPDGYDEKEVQEVPERKKNEKNSRGDLKAQYIFEDSGRIAHDILLLLRDESPEPLLQPLTVLVVPHQIR